MHRQTSEVDLAVGFVGLQFWARGYTADDDKDTAETELRELLDYQQVGVQVELGVKLAEWMSVDYVLSARRLPMLIDRWQVSNNLVLSFSAKFL